MVSMNRRLKRFQETINKIPLQELLNIPEKDKNGTLKIEVIEISTFTVTILIEYIYKYDGFYFENLPPEINNMIDSYLYRPLTLRLHILYPQEYPFTAPLWFLTKVISNKEDNKNMIVYYSDKIKNHNNLNSSQWQPAMDIHSDILLFISTIIDFDKTITAF